MKSLEGSHSSSVSRISVGTFCVRVRRLLLEEGWPSSFSSFQVYWPSHWKPYAFTLLLFLSLCFKSGSCRTGWGAGSGNLWNRCPPMRSLDGLPALSRVVWHSSCHIGSKRSISVRWTQLCQDILLTYGCACYGKVLGLPLAWTRTFTATGQAGMLDTRSDQIWHSLWVCNNTNGRLKYEFMNLHVWYASFYVSKTPSGIPGICKTKITIIWNLNW